MARVTSQPTTNVALLTKSIEFLVRNLVRILVGKITLIRLQEIVQTVFIQEAEDHLRKERPGRDVPLTSLALTSGLDTRKLAEIRNSDAYRKPKHLTSDFLHSLTPESCIVDLWTSDSRFTDVQTGKPRVLDIWGEHDTFEAVVREAIRSRGITVTSALERMQKSQLVSVQNENRVKLESKELAPKSVREQIGNIKLGLDAAGHLLGSVQRNLESAATGEQKLFQRGSWTHRLNPVNREKVEMAMREFLENADEEARRILAPFEEPSADPSHLTAGIGMYYFESETF